MARVQVSEIRENLADFINRTAYGNERQIIERHGKPVAALVSMEDIEMLQAIEDAVDIADARKALASLRRGRTVSWEEIKKEL